MVNLWRTRYILLILVFPLVLGAQQKAPSQAELEKMMKDMEKQADKMKNDPRVKKALQQAGANSDLSEDGTELPPWGKMPVRQSKALASLPRNILSADSLRVFIKGLAVKLDKASTQESRIDISKIKQTLGNNAVAISRSALAAWYKNNPLTALNLASQAASIAPDQPEVLNTFAALLNLCGYPERALPVLQYLNGLTEGNSTVLNNMGQAYFALGDQANAEKYFLMCISHSENHVEANKTLGILYAGKGQMQKAQSCILHSLRGGFTQTAVDMAEYLQVNSDEIDDAVLFLLPKMKSVEYVNGSDYRLPPQCENVATASQTLAQLEAYREFLQKLKQKYIALQNEEAQQTQNDAMQIMNAVKQGQMVRVLKSPLFEKAKRKYMKVLESFGHFNQDVVLPALMDLSKEKDKLEDAYNKRYAEINSSDANNKCDLLNALANQYLPLFAANYRNYIDKYLNIYRNYVNDLIYWGQFMGVLHDRHSNSYAYVQGYLQHLIDISRQYTIISPACNDQKLPAPELPEGQVIKTDCPIDIGINLGIADISIDCESIGIDIDAGIALSAQKNFASGETTLAIGIGLGSSKGFEIPGIDVKSSLGVSEQMYIVFDGDNNVSDVGIKMEAGAHFEIGGSAGPLSTDIAGTGASAGFTLGLNSGWNFSGEALGSSLKL